MTQGRDDDGLTLSGGYWGGEKWSNGEFSLPPSSRFLYTHLHSDGRNDKICW